MIDVDESEPIQNIIVLGVRTDQAGMVGRVRRLHALGMAILRVEIVQKEK